MFYFNAIFQNETNFLIRYQPPAAELDITLEYFRTANQKLLSALSDSGQTIDPTIQQILYGDVCSLIEDKTAIADCESSTIGRTLGLLGINNKFYDNTVNSWAQYRQSLTFDNAAKLLVVYAGQIVHDIVSVPQVYAALRTHLLSSFKETIIKQQKQNLTVFILIVIFLFLFEVVTQKIVIQNLKRFDLKVKRILKIIPFNMVQGNRLFEYYLKDEFKKELKDIKQFS